MAIVQDDSAAKLMTLADVRAFYVPCLTKTGVEVSLTYDLIQPEFRRECYGDAPHHPRLADLSPGSADWFNAVWILKGEAGDIYPSDLTDPRDVGEDDLRIFLLAFWLWWEDGKGLAVDVTGLERKARVAANPLDERLPKARGNSRWTFMQALQWALLRNYANVAIADDGLQRPTFDGPFYVMSREHWLVAQECRLCGGSDPAARLELCQCLQKRVKDLGDLAIATGATRTSLPHIEVDYLGYNRVLIWPNGADDLAFDRLDIEARWTQFGEFSQVPMMGAFPTPAESGLSGNVSAAISTGAAEIDCREWLIRQFKTDPDRRRSKASFRDAALAEFPNRLTERGFNLRVWPMLAKEHERDRVGAKKQS